MSLRTLEGEAIQEILTVGLPRHSHLAPRKDVGFERV
jgi:hypothetical protein